MNMIERVAQAMYESHGFVKGWEHPDTVRIWHKSMHNSARAAMKAMINNTSKMDSAGYDAYPESVIKTGVDHLDIYRAMINAALADDE